MAALQHRLVGGEFRGCLVKTVCHISSVHQAHDVRIALKECRSLSADHGEVHLVAPGELPAGISGIRHHPLEAGRGGRLRRVFFRGCRAYRIAAKLRADVYHFHDPELIPFGLLLRASGRRVLYDVHEDVPRDVLSKDWIAPFLRRPVAAGMEGVEWFAAKMFTGIVAATPTIALRFPPEKTVVVQNFPILREFPREDPVPYARREPLFAYVGGLTEARGAVEMVAAVDGMGGEGVRLQLAGAVASPGLGERLAAMPGWGKVDFHGWLDRTEIAALLGRVRAGLVVLHPIRNYAESWPIKLFEYMAAGLPVIASDFPLWREIVEEAGCGLLVDALDPAAIAKAMQWILDHPEEARAMGERGRRAVEEKYNWETEAEKLRRFYRTLP